MKRIKQILFLSLITAFSLPLTAKEIKHKTKRNPSSVIRDMRSLHAKELLGHTYVKNKIKNIIHKEDLNKSVINVVRSSLKKSQQRFTHVIADAIIAEAIKHKFDPMFLAAVIMNESSFDIYSRGTSGEIGLMQIMPKTGMWLAQKYKIKWTGNKMLENPVTNIKLGAAYLKELHGKYNGKGKLYLAAYNMGPANVKDALRRNIVPQDYSSRVMKRYVAIYNKH